MLPWHQHCRLPTPDAPTKPNDSCHLSSPTLLTVASTLSDIIRLAATNPKLGFSGRVTGQQYSTARVTSNTMHSTSQYLNPACSSMQQQKLASQCRSPPRTECAANPTCYQVAAKLAIVFAHMHAFIALEQVHSTCVGLPGTQATWPSATHLQGGHKIHPMDMPQIDVKHKSTPKQHCFSRRWMSKQCMHMIEH